MSTGSWDGPFTQPWACLSGLKDLVSPDHQLPLRTYDFPLQDNQGLTGSSSDAVLQPWRSFKVQQLLTPRILLGVVVFFFAWAKQNQCHRYLASLQKYTLPSEGWFQYIICPHYTSECLLYVALAFIAAPPGSLFNRTVLCGVIFVAVNLGATAHGTKQWYASKFGPNQVRRRWKMIPFVF